MTRKWLALVLLAAGVILGGSDLEAQRSGNVLSLNNHGNKYESGGLGVRLSTGLAIGGDIYSGAIVNTSDGPIIGNGIAHERTESATGIGFDWQFGHNGADSKSGTNISLDMTTYSVDGQDNAGVNRFLFDATVFRLGFDFIINFYQSENVGADGRRERENFGLSMFFGPKVSWFAGDLEDLNGLASIGMDIGFIAEYPLSNEWQITPSAWFEVNYHMSGDAERSIFNATDTGLNGPTQSAALDGIVVRTHSVVPPYVLNFGGDIAWTPAFIGQDGNIINNWRFTLGAYLNLPLELETFAADAPGDPLRSDGDGSTYLTIALGASYLW
ncbi:MAG: hypothetical protein KDB07_02510 [Planctomycetes bacterium]|nr:hypothetical protein [Planctomycetota bacterium]